MTENSNETASEYSQILDRVIGEGWEIKEIHSDSATVNEVPVKRGNVIVYRMGELAGIFNDFNSRGVYTMMYLNPEAAGSRQVAHAMAIMTEMALGGAG